MKRAKVISTNRLPNSNLFGRDCLLIYDRRLERIPSLVEWISRWPFVYRVDAGEKLKDIRNFPGHIENIVEITREFAPGSTVVVGLGGGSVGDFTGFVASILKRGVRLIHIPSTWLAAMDSAHGGKTALNVGSAKNQIGTFYPAESVYLIKSLLTAQPEKRLSESMGELAKIALLDGGNWSRRILTWSKPEVNKVWHTLNDAIRSKQKIVTRDPLEKLGPRRLLNLGHTLGHVIEIVHDLPHGVAVGQGLHFSLQWSFQRGDLSVSEFQKCQFLLKRLRIEPLLESQNLTMSVHQFRKILSLDKKRISNSEIDFVFLRKWGAPFLQKVTIHDLLNEAARQGWVKK